MLMLFCQPEEALSGGEVGRHTGDTLLLCVPRRRVPPISMSYDSVVGLGDRWGAAADTLTGSAVSCLRNR